MTLSGKWQHTPTHNERENNDQHTGLGLFDSNGLEIVKALRQTLNITDWYSDQEGSHDIWQFLRGEISAVPPQPDAVLAFAGFYRDFFPTYQVMITRRGLHYADFHQLTNEFALNYYYFYQLIVDKQPELMIFANMPHEGPDYVLYQLAKMLKIKTLLCYQTIFSNHFLMCTCMEDFGQFHTVPPIFEHAEIQLEEGHQQSLFYMQSVVKQQQAEQFSTGRKLALKVAAIVNKLVAVVLKSLELATSPKHINLVKIGKKLVTLKNQALYQEVMAQHKTGRDTLQNILDTSKHLVYFPLHLQPELTTSAIGGIFQDQLYAIETLRALLSDDWIILVKENPKQDHFQRDELFFQRLAAIPGVLLVDKLFPSVELIKKSALTATITGTAGWEAVKGGNKCVAFGQAWYASLENCLTYQSDLTPNDLMDFMAKERPFSAVLASFDRLCKKNGAGVVDSAYAGMVDNYSHRDNAVLVARSIMAVIENPATDWR